MTTISSAAALLSSQRSTHATQGASSAFGTFASALDASSSSDPTADPATAQPLADQMQSLLLELQSASSQAVAPADPTDDSDDGATVALAPVASAPVASAQDVADDADPKATTDSTQSTSDADTSPSLLAEMQQTVTQTLQNLTNPATLISLASLMA